MQFFDISKASTSDFPFVALGWNNWDDYGFKTTFASTLWISESESVPLGDVKILKFDQTGGRTPMPDHPVDELGADYCSVGPDLAYYERLLQLGPALYQPYLRGISDAAYSEHIRAKFEDLPGYSASLLRFSGAARAMNDAPRLFKAEPHPMIDKGEGFVFSFKTSLADQANAIIVNFDFKRQDRLPHRMNVLIGYNGTGKTRLLSNLAIVASGYGYDTAEALLHRRSGNFVGERPPFKRVIVVSYSAFDAFEIPGKTAAERAQLAEKGEIFGYVYCGLRELAPEAGTMQSVAGPAYRLKRLDQIEQEFVDAVQRVRKSDRSAALIDVLRPILLDASFQRIGLHSIYSSNDDVSDQTLLELFKPLSSGHKVVLKILAEMTAHVDAAEPTLVLIDEPETHLHPPLLAAFLKGVRNCLERFDAYSVVSTHSPVVLQETPSRYVQVLRRAGDRSRADTPAVETFGEDIGVITSDVFNLDDGSTDWHETLRLLAQTLSVSEIEQLFRHRLGFAAKSYVASLRGDVK